MEFYFDEKKQIYVDRFRDRSFSNKFNIWFTNSYWWENNAKKFFFAKYINSPETQFFKDNNLYNIDKARTLKWGDQIFLVEGYMDVIGLNNKGIQNCVANLGTALTEKQMKLLINF